MPGVPSGSVYVVLARSVLGRPVPALLPFPGEVQEGALTPDLLMSLVALCVQQPTTRRKETELKA